MLESNENPNFFLFELSISKCFTTICNLSDAGFLAPNYFENYRFKLYSLQQTRKFKWDKEFFLNILKWSPEEVKKINFKNEHEINYIVKKEEKEGRFFPYCNKQFFQKVLKWSPDDADKIIYEDIETLNSHVKSYKNSFVNYDGRMVQFSDDYIIDHKKYESVYLEFLCLKLCDTKLNFIKEFLSYHLLKHSNKDKFISDVKDYYDELNEDLKNDNTKQRILEWIESINQSYIEKTKKLVERENTDVETKKSLEAISENINTNQNQPYIVSLKEQVEKTFSYMLKVDPRKHKQILEDEDFENLINWVSNISEITSVKHE